MNLCHYCPQEATIYVYALGVNPLDASSEFCADHADTGREWLDMGDGTEFVRVTQTKAH